MTEHLLNRDKEKERQKNVERVVAEKEFEKSVRKREKGERKR